MANGSIASISGVTPNYTIVGLQTGTTNLLCSCWGRPIPVSCPLYVFTANLQMNGVAANQKQTPGGYVPLNANNDNGSTVTNGVPATRDMNTNPIPNEKDLVQTTLGVGGLPANWPVTYVLSATTVQNGHGAINVWNTMTKQSQFTLPYTWNAPANTWPNCYVEGVAEGYAEREIALTLTVTPLGATAASTDMVNLTVTPVLQTLMVTKSSGSGPPAWSVTPGYLAGLKMLTSNGGSNVPANTPSVNMSASALNTNVVGQLSFIQAAAFSNNLKDSDMNVVGAILAIEKVLSFYQTYAGLSLIDCGITDDIPFYKLKPNITTTNGVQTRTDQDTPKIPAADILPQVGQKNDTQLDASQKFTLYAVWAYSDGTYWPLGKVTWEVRYAGAFTVALPLQFNPNANNAVNSSSPLVRSNALADQALSVMANPDPKNKNQTPIANNGGGTWYTYPYPP